MKLYGYWRSTSSYRVRIALNMKGLAHEHHPVHLVREGGEQHKPAYRAVNPAGKVPALELDSGQVLTQSLAIIEYVDAVFDGPPLLPHAHLDRARARSFAHAIACDMQPFHNKATLDYLADPLGHDKDTVLAWTRHWTQQLLPALEAQCRAPFVMGNALSVADACLVPAMYAARRFKVDLTAYPRLVAADLAARAEAPVAAAAPERQPDAPADATAI